MFNTQEQEIITAGRANGKSPQEIEAAIQRYRTGFVPAETPVAQDVAIGVAKGVGQSVKSTGDLVAAGAPRLVLGPVLSSIPQIRKKVEGAVTSIKDKVQNFVGLTNENLELKNTPQKVGAGIAMAAEFATPFVTTRLARLAPSVVRLSEEASPRAAGIVDRAKDLISPKKTPVQAVAQIGQGPTKSLSSVARALEVVDTKGVKTYSDLSARIKTKIPELARAVDQELEKDPTAYRLEQLVAKQATKGGQEIEVDYVSRALDDLKALYTATGDDLARADIDEIITHAKANGLTRKEVNDISRVYGEEFSQKAFSKTGDPLTSTNAQAFETTRSGLKTVARQGLGGDEAKALDEQLSALYDTRKLVERNVEAVNKLQARIQERGLVEKAGYYVAKYADVLSGGTIRGFVGGILPRGAGYKTMNALDIEEALRKNLDVIEQALAQKTDKELLAILRKKEPIFKKPGPANTSQ